MPKLLKPFDYYLDWQDDLLLLQLRQETLGLDDINIDHAPRNFENITRGMYRHLEELLITPKKNRLDAITPYFLYPLFWAKPETGLLSKVERWIVSVWFRENPLDEMGIPKIQRSTTIKRLQKIELHLKASWPIEMSTNFFRLREPTHFRNGVQPETIDRIDAILTGTVKEFPDWLRMRFGLNKEQRVM